jgi:hypothetical protein
LATRRRVLELALGLAVCVLALGAVRELTAARPLPPPPPPRAARPIPATSPPVDPPVPGGYGVIAAKNLFSPSRTEAPAAAAVAAGPKPTLHGVVMDGAKSRAYLEEPAQKRTFGYLVGDPVGAGRVESIAADRVTIGGGGGAVEVLLRDQGKPRAAAPAAAPASRETPSASQPAAPPPATASAPAAAWPATQGAATAPAPAARTDR